MSEFNERDTECENCGRSDPCEKCGGITSERFEIYEHGVPTGRFVMVTYPDREATGQA